MFFPLSFTNEYDEQLAKDSFNRSIDTMRKGLEAFGLTFTEGTYSKMKNFDNSYNLIFQNAKNEFNDEQRNLFNRLVEISVARVKEEQL